MMLQDLVNQLLERVGGADRAALEEQYGLWDLFTRKLRGKKSIQVTGMVSENELQSAQAAALSPDNKEMVEQFIESHYRRRYQEDAIHARNIWSRESVLEPILVGGEEREFDQQEAIAYWMVSDIFFKGINPFEKKLQPCSGGLFCSTDETGNKVEDWNAAVRSIIEKGDGAVAWSDLLRELGSGSRVLSDDDARLMQKFIRFSSDFTVTEKQEIQLSPPGGQKATGLSKGLQMYLRARKFPAPFQELAGAYRMPRWILLSCLLCRTDMFTLLPTGEFRLFTR